jgi:Zn-finger nucleic acid-binding protein
MRPCIGNGTDNCHSNGLRNDGMYAELREFRSSPGRSGLPTVVKPSPASSGKPVDPPIVRALAFHKHDEAPQRTYRRLQGSSTSSDDVGSENDREMQRDSGSSLGRAGVPAASQMDDGNVPYKKRPRVEGDDSEGSSESSQEHAEERIGKAVTFRMLYGKMSTGTRAFTRCYCRCRMCGLLMRRPDAYQHYSVMDCKSAVQSGRLAHFPCPHCKHVFLRRRDLEDHLALVRFPSRAPKVAPSSDEDSDTDTGMAEPDASARRRRKIRGIVAGGTRWKQR